MDALLSGGVDFVVVGGASAILHGALAMTQDLDVVHSMVPANIARLVLVLGRLEAFVRDPARRRLRPEARHLTSGGQLNLTTMLGPLDLLGRPHDGRGSDELLAHSEVLSDGTRRVRVVDLPTVIEIKTTAGRAKDRLIVPILLALLRERERR